MDGTVQYMYVQCTMRIAYASSFTVYRFKTAYSQPKKSLREALIEFIIKVV